MRIYVYAKFGQLVTGEFIILTVNRGAAELPEVCCS